MKREKKEEGKLQCLKKAIQIFFTGLCFTYKNLPLVYLFN